MTASNGHGSRRTLRRTRWMRGALALVLAGALGAVACSDGSDSDDSAEDPGSAAPPTTTSTTLATGGIEVDAPDKWQAIPVASLGFGVAVPPGWEAVVLSDEVLENLERSAPETPGFLDSAHHARATGAVFYAAGQDGAGQVTDLKVVGAPGTGIDDGAGLRSYAGELVDAAGDDLSDVQIDEVDGADRPTVRVRYRVVGDPGRGEDVTAEGTEMLTVGPKGVVWSLIITSEDSATHDDLAGRIIDTLTFASDSTDD